MPIKNTIDEFGNESDSITERQEQKKKRNIDTPDNIKFGDMTPEFRMKYLQMLEQQRKKK